MAVAGYMMHATQGFQLNCCRDECLGTPDRAQCPLVTRSHPPRHWSHWCVLALSCQHSGTWPIIACKYLHITPFYSECVCSRSWVPAAPSAAVLNLPCAKSENIWDYYYLLQLEYAYLPKFHEGLFTILVSLTPHKYSNWKSKQKIIKWISM